MNRDDFILFLASVPTFADFGPREREVLDRAMTVEDFPDGHVFCAENQAPRALYLIVQGQVEAHHRRTGNGGMVDVEHLEAGELFGLAGLIGHGCPEASFRAVGPVTAASLPMAAFELLYTAHAPLARHFQDLIARQLVRNWHHCVALLTGEGENP